MKGVPVELDGGDTADDAVDVAEAVELDAADAELVALCVDEAVAVLEPLRVLVEVTSDDEEFVAAADAELVELCVDEAVAVVVPL